MADAYEILTLLVQEDPGLQSEPKLPVEQIYAAILLYRSFALFVDMVPHPDMELDTTGARLYRVTSAAADAVRDAYLRIYAESPDEHRRGAEVALYGHPDLSDKLVAMSAPLDRLTEAIKSISRIARSYLRIVRIEIFPPPPATDRPNPYTWLHEISKAWLEPPSQNGASRVAETQPEQ